jgi:hypothetical protein
VSTAFVASLRLEAGMVRRTRWVALSVALALGLVGLFVGVAARESAVIGFTGWGRVLAGVVQASLLFLPLLATFACVGAVTGARQSGALEWLLSHPVSRGAWFWGLATPRLLAVGGPLLLAVFGLFAIAALGGNPVPVGALLSFAALLLTQTLCWSAFALLVSVLSRTPEQALLRGLTVWVAGAALVDFVLLSVLLRWDLPPGAVFAIAVLNPMQAGRVAMIAALDPQMGSLGPVGVFMLTKLGPAATQAWGLSWPAIAGGIALLAARAAFGRRDVL